MESRLYTRRKKRLNQGYTHEKEEIGPRMHTMTKIRNGIKTSAQEEKKRWKIYYTQGIFCDFGHNQEKEMLISK